jgi:hypothetical protein
MLTCLSKDQQDEECVFEEIIIEPELIIRESA